MSADLPIRHWIYFAQRRGHGFIKIGRSGVPNVRLWGVDAPELRDTGKVEAVAGMRARVALGELVSGKAVTVRAVECDAYGRTVANVEAGGVDLSLAMVRAGMAYVFAHYAFRPDMLDRFKALADAEREAREKGAGLWQVWLAKP